MMGGVPKIWVPVLLVPFAIRRRKKNVNLPILRYVLLISKKNMLIMDISTSNKPNQLE